MLTLRDDPFPLEAARDMLGLVRLIYAARACRQAGAVELRRIHAVGELLDCAVRAGRVASPHTLLHAAAWQKAERACELISTLVGMTDGAEPIVLAAVARARGR